LPGLPSCQKQWGGTPASGLVGAGRVQLPRQRVGVPVSCSFVGPVQLPRQRVWDTNLSLSVSPLPGLPSCQNQWGGAPALGFVRVPCRACPVAEAKGWVTGLRLQDAEQVSHKHTNMCSEQYVKACKREMKKPVHRGNLPGHVEQGRSFDSEPRTNLHNLRKDFRVQDKASNLSKCIKAPV